MLVLGEALPDRLADEATSNGEQQVDPAHRLHSQRGTAEFGQVVNEETDRLSLEAEDRDFGPEVYIEDGMP